MSSRVLLSGGVLTGAIALLHVGIILGGAPWYRFFGAGERMARLAARGSAYPAMVTATIAAVLTVWMVYALSGAGVLRPLPFLRPVLLVIALIFLARGALGIPVVLTVKHPYAVQLQARMPFMIVTSAISALLGVCYAVGAEGLRSRRP